MKLCVLAGVLAAPVLAGAAVAQSADDQGQALTEAAIEACFAYQTSGEAFPRPPEGFGAPLPSGWSIAPAGEATNVGIAGMVFEGDDGVPVGTCDVLIEGPAPWFPRWMEQRRLAYQEDGWTVIASPSPPGANQIGLSKYPASLTFGHLWEQPIHQVRLTWSEF